MHCGCFCDILKKILASQFIIRGCMEKKNKKIFEAKLSKVEMIAEGVKKFDFTISTPFSFLPGQYVWIEIPQLRVSDPKGNRRAFSICSSPNTDNTISVIARIGTGGYKQSFFSLKEGENIRVHGPFGSAFVVSNGAEVKNIMMIAGGVGIAPFLPIVQSIKLQQQKVNCFLVYLNREKQATPFLKELSILKRNNKFFDYLVSYKNFGREQFESIPEKLRNSAQWFISGPQGMVDSVHDELVKFGVSTVDMIFENFYPTSKIALCLEDILKQLKHDNNIFAQAIQNSTNHTVITDVNGVVLFANFAATTMTGYSNEEIIGNTPRLWGGMMEPRFYKEFWNQKAAGMPFVGGITNRKKNGELYYAIAHIAPIFDEQKRVIGYIGTEEDYTVMKNQEEIIKEKEQRLNLALEANKDGLWDWDIPSGNVFFSLQLKTMLGYSENEMKGHVDAWKELIHPDETAAIEGAVKRLLDGTDQYYETEHRLRCKDGTYKWILDRGKVVERNDKGEPIRAVGTHTDITQSKERESELARLNNAMVDRELKMIELKKQIKELKSRTK